MKLENAKPRLPHLQKNKLGYCLLIPSTLLLAVISVYPVVSGIFLSMRNRNLLRPKQDDFIFLDNYIQLFRDKEFLGSLEFTFVYTFSVVVIAYLAGFSLALLLGRNLRFRGFFRTVFLLPWVIPAVVAVINWTWVLNDQVGIINTTLKAMGLIDKPILFLADYALIKLTVIMVSVWKQMPFMMITLLAGLQSVPKDLYEAAEIDGAGFFRRLCCITLPMIKPVSFISTTLCFVWTFNTFENIWLLTGGGPNGFTFTLPILSYYTAFLRQKISYASAIATTMIVVMLLMSIVYFKLQFGTNAEKQITRRRAK